MIILSMAVNYEIKDSLIQTKIVCKFISFENQKRGNHRRERQRGQKISMQSDYLKHSLT